MEEPGCYRYIFWNQLFFDDQTHSSLTFCRSWWSHWIKCNRWTLETSKHSWIDFAKACCSAQRIRFDNSYSKDCLCLLVMKSWTRLKTHLAEKRQTSSHPIGFLWYLSLSHGEQSAAIESLSLHQLQPIRLLASWYWICLLWFGRALPTCFESWPCSTRAVLASVFLRSCSFEASGFVEKPQATYSSLRFCLLTDLLS